MHTQLHRRIVTIYTHTYMTCLHTYAYTVIHMCNNMYSNNIHTYLHNRALNPSNILPEIFISTHSQNSIYPMGCNSRMPVARGAPSVHHLQYIRSVIKPTTTTTTIYPMACNSRYPPRPLPPFKAPWSRIQRMTQSCKCVQKCQKRPGVEVKET